ncbi:hypothetical protein BAY1663_02930 [Pseudomonas sp. BAY1663]|uniref:hypothetical protein n=1 Tax=Pseudomonas sp. BAY1663 TaxID=1439940 RepID=UPI00042DE157|nr:hypothetical protein [Pseudomonas sp. BAY1663]EXF44683.1 hypothetical protein BAY1663_02930 [Pseudomonas sp. BAY1663]
MRANPALRKHRVLRSGFARVWCEPRSAGCNPPYACTLGFEIFFIKNNALFYV